MPRSRQSEQRLVQVRGDLLRERRRARGWTQAELALKAGYDVRTVQRAEGGGWVRVSTVSDLAQVLSCEPSYLQVGQGASTAPSPVRQLVRWGPPDRGAGIVITDVDGGRPEDFIPWHQLYPELEKRLLPKTFRNPTGYRFVTRDFHGKKDWLVYVIDRTGQDICALWFGGDPLRGGRFDGFIRVGNASQVWQTYQRCSDATYVRVDSMYGSVEEALSNS